MILTYELAIVKRIFVCIYHKNTMYHFFYIEHQCGYFRNISIAAAAAAAGNGSDVTFITFTDWAKIRGQR